MVIECSIGIIPVCMQPLGRSPQVALIYIDCFKGKSARFLIVNASVAFNAKEA